MPPTYTGVFKFWPLRGTDKRKQHQYTISRHLSIAFLSITDRKRERLLKLVNYFPISTDLVRKLHTLWQVTHQKHDLLFFLLNICIFFFQVLWSFCVEVKLLRILFFMSHPRVRKSAHVSSYNSYGVLFFQNLYTYI